MALLGVGCKFIDDSYSVAPWKGIIQDIIHGFGLFSSNIVSSPDGSKSQSERLIYLCLVCARMGRSFLGTYLVLIRKEPPKHKEINLGIISW